MRMKKSSCRRCSSRFQSRASMRKEKGNIFHGWRINTAATSKKLNARYDLAAKSFSELNPEEYWLRPEELNWVGCARPNAEDFAKRTPDFYRWIDNQTHLAEVLEDYLATMKKHWRELEPNLFVEPLLHQWGYF